jgi:D-tyrosyl-tRNA(Tyr) deacylase
MKAVIQRVSRAAVRTDGVTAGEISRGLLVLLGVGRDDTEADADYLLGKIAGLRIFPDPVTGKMDLSATDIGGGLLIISQFTLYGDVRKGRRPSFDAAAPPEKARKLYEYFLARAAGLGLPTASGVFQASMQVELVNEGPVTIVLESPGGDSR